MVSSVSPSRARPDLLRVGGWSCRQGWALRSLWRIEGPQRGRDPLVRWLGPCGGERVAMPGPRRPSASERRLDQWSGRLALEVMRSGVGASPCLDQEEGLGRPPF